MRRKVRREPHDLPQPNRESRDRLEVQDKIVVCADVHRRDVHAARYGEGHLAESGCPAQQKKDGRKEGGLEAFHEGVLSEDGVCGADGPVGCLSAIFGLKWRTTLGSRADPGLLPLPHPLQQPWAIELEDLGIA